MVDCSSNRRDVALSIICQVDLHSLSSLSCFPGHPWQSWNSKLQSTWWAPRSHLTSVPSPCRRLSIHTPVRLCYPRRLQILVSLPANEPQRDMALGKPYINIGSVLPPNTANEWKQKRLGKNTWLGHSSASSLRRTCWLYAASGASSAASPHLPGEEKEDKAISGRPGGEKRTEDTEKRKENEEKEKESRERKGNKE